MKIKEAPFFPVHLLVASFWLAAGAMLLASPEDQPSIHSVRLDGGNVVVVARVPTGITKVTLESRRRLGVGAWEPRAVSRLTGDGGECVFRLPRTEAWEMIRVRADATEPLPVSFYQGTNRFAGQPAGSSGTFAPLAGPADASGNANSSSAPTREVVESDIWKVRGDTLYFFNQYRGLQIIDLSNPDAARVTGTLALPAAGEQMYLLGISNVVLLAQDGCGWSSDGPESKLVVVSVQNGAPGPVNELPIHGTIRESRLVGTALYVASETYRPVTTNTWEWGTVVSSFDLADPTAPALRQTLWFAGYGNVVSATDVFLFVGTAPPENANRSLVRCLDITAPDGSMREVASIPTAGVVGDKFKMTWDHVSETFTAISEASALNTGTGTWVTRLETFRLPHPASTGPSAWSRLGAVELGHGERLFATRFDGHLAYVVTFRRIDPLWVVDFSDATRPRIAGELQVPGWSTYIHPLGDRLLSVGIDNTNGTRVAVSLFDVHDPSKPALLSRVALGDSYSWSEANNDEKAFNVLPDEGLILLPFQGGWTNGYASGVQLVDLNLQQNTLGLRGVIQQRFQPRRAALHADRIVSLSGTELLSVDAADRDHPQVKGRLELAWSVDRILLHEDYVVALTTAVWGDGAPAIRIAPAEDPDRVVASVALADAEPILGATIREGRLYVAQGRPTADIAFLNGDPTGPSPVAASNLVVSIFDLTKLPGDPPLLGAVTADVKPLGWGAQFQLLWPRPGLLVLAGGGGGYWNPWLDWGFLPIVGPAGPALWRPVYWGDNGGRVLAFDVSEPTAPRYLSDLNLAENPWWNFSAAFCAEGLVFLSHAVVEHPEPIVVFDEPSGQWKTNTAPDWFWVQRSFLDVIDYADPRVPTIRRPVALPGGLRGISQGGALVYTIGPHWRPDANWSYDGTEWLDAGAYDGVDVHAVDSLPLPAPWPHPVLMDDGGVFLGRPAGTNTTSDVVEAWRLSLEGRFKQVGTMKVPWPVQDLRNFGDLLVGLANNQIYLFDVTDPAVPVETGTGGPSACLWFDLRNADGALHRGVWLPLGLYGTAFVPGAGAGR
jgi:hypothetical protein